MATATATLKIDPEFQAACSEQTADEIAILERRIIEDGCRDPIVVWKGTIIDGHTRYEICRKHDIAFDVVEMDFDDREAALDWIRQNQYGRRNLDSSRRAMMAAQLATYKHGGIRKSKDEKAEQGADVPLDVSISEAASEIGVGERTIKHAKKVLADGSKALQKAVHEGTVAVTTAAVISELPKDKQTELVKQGSDAVVAAANKLKKKKSNAADIPVDRQFAKLDERIAEVYRLIVSIGKEFDHGIKADIVESINRANKDIGKWRDAYKKAEKAEATKE